MFFKTDLRVQMDAKSSQLKIESVRENANGKTINAFEVSFMIQFMVHLIIHLELHLMVNFNIYIHKDTQERVPDVLLKGTPLVALELHLFIKLSMYKMIQHFKESFKMHKKVTKRTHLTLHLMCT